MILIIVTAAVIQMRTQSTTTCSRGLEGICVLPLYNFLSLAILWMKTAEIFWFPSKAVASAAWGQPALRKQNINYAVQETCVQEAVEVKRKVS